MTIAGTTLFGLSLFATLFLGAVLAVFLTLNVVRGDAERGLLQPLVVRPVGRTTLLLARFAAAAAVCAVYVWIVFAAALLITHQLGDGWWPDRFVRPALGLAGAVVVVVGLSVLGSALFTGTANGIAIFMLFGAGLVAGLLGQIGEALGSPTLERVATVSSWVLPFEALYQDALHQISADSFGLTRVALQLGPFGGAEAGGAALWLYAAAYLGIVLGASRPLVQPPRPLARRAIDPAEAGDRQDVAREMARSRDELVAPRPPGAVRAREAGVGRVELEAEVRAALGAVHPLRGHVVAEDAGRIAPRPEDADGDAEPPLGRARLGLVQPAAHHVDRPVREQDARQHAQVALLGLREDRGLGGGRGRKRQRPEDCGDDNCFAAHVSPLCQGAQA